MQKRVLIISGSPRKNGNSQLLCERFQEGAKASGHHVDLIQIAERQIGFCRACVIMESAFCMMIWLKF